MQSGAVMTRAILATVWSISVRGEVVWQHAQIFAFVAVYKAARAMDTWRAHITCLRGYRK